jgi:hypothetical protein
MATPHRNPLPTIIHMVLSRVVRDFTPSPARIGKREREIRRVQNKKELWRLPLTTPDTSSREEVRP